MALDYAGVGSRGRGGGGGRRWRRAVDCVKKGVGAVLEIRLGGRKASVDAGR